jgi:DNA adenine methylase
MPLSTQPESPLRYPGGKRRIVNFVKALFRENNLMDGHYAEPYCGGAGVALSLLFQEYSRKIHINDKSRSIYAFWHSVVHDSENFISLIDKTKISMKEWHRQREVQKVKETADLLSLGFSTFFMNRTNRSGIIAGGVIGGLKQDGKWKLDVRYDKKSLIERVKKIAKYRRRISVYNLDAIDFIQNILPTIPSPSLLNLDPPYYIKGQSVYDNFYEHDDHIEIAKVVSRLDSPWIATYDNVSEIVGMYKRFRQRTYDLSYTAGTKQIGTEIMIFGKGVRIPSKQEIVPASKSATASR